jgi:hypothetical protein
MAKPNRSVNHDSYEGESGLRSLGACSVRRYREIWGYGSKVLIVCLRRLPAMTTESRSTGSFGLHLGHLTSYVENLSRKRPNGMSQADKEEDEEDLRHTGSAETSVSLQDLVQS